MVNPRVSGDDSAFVIVWNLKKKRKKNTRKCEDFKVKIKKINVCSFYTVGNKKWLPGIGGRLITGKCTGHLESRCTPQPGHSKLRAILLLISESQCPLFPAPHTGQHWEVQMEHLATLPRWKMLRTGGPRHGTRVSP